MHYKFGNNIFVVSTIIPPSKTMLCFVWDIMDIASDRKRMQDNE